MRQVPPKETEVVTTLGDTGGHGFYSAECTNCSSTMTHDYSITFLSARQSSSCLKLQCSPVSQNQRWFLTFLLSTKPVLFNCYTLHNTAFHCLTTLAIIKQSSYGMVVGFRLQLFGKMRHSEHISIALFPDIQNYSSTYYRYYYYYYF